MLKLTPILLAATTLMTVVMASQQPSTFVVTDGPQKPMPVVSAPSGFTINDQALATLEKLPLSARPPLRVQWIFFTMNGCQPCVTSLGKIQPVLEPAGWEFGEGQAVHFRISNASVNPSEAAAFNVTQTPTMVLAVDGRETIRIDAFQLLAPNIENITTLYNQATERYPVPLQSGFGAVSIAEVSGQQSIDSLFAKLTSRGSDSVFTFGKAELYVPDELPVTFRSSPTSMALQFAQKRPRLKYDVGILRVGQDVSGVVLERHRAVLQLPGFPDLQVTLKP